MHELTGRAIKNEYEEPGCAFEGTFTCSEGDCQNDERDYRPLCERCDQKRDAAEYTLDEDRCVCDCCWPTNPIS